MKIIKNCAEAGMLLLTVAFFAIGRMNAAAVAVCVLLTVWLEIENRIDKQDKRKIASGIVFWSFALWMFNDLMAIGKFQIYIGWRGIFNLLIYVLIVCLFAGIISNLKVSMACSGALLFLLGIVNAVIKAIRRTPISAGDIFSVKTAMAVAGNYTMEFDKEFVLKVGAGCLLLAAAAFLLYYFLWSDKENRRNERITGKVRIGITAGSILIICLLAFTSLVTSISGRKPDYFTHETNGFALNLYLQMKDIIVREPENYQKNLAEVSQTMASDKAEKETYPNIVVIMNESFADMQTLGSFETNQEVLPVWNGLSENAIKGNLYMSVYGGNTANSEYEFLTGSSIQYFSERIVPFQLYMNEERPSVFSQMEELGYETAFMHPYKAYSWNRPSVYAALGVDSMMYEEDMTGLERFRGFASDESQYEYVKKSLENPDREKPLFLFDVTVQNHGGYTQPVEELEKITINGHEGEFKETENYLTLAHESDRALGKLLEELKIYDEPTVVLFFGDHQPAIETGFVEMAEKKSQADFTLEDRQKMYCTPFFLWANYDMDSEYVEEMSANYLSTFLCDKLGLPMTGFQKFLQKMKNEMPVINTTGIVDKDGNYLSADELSKEQTQRLEEYHSVIYNYMFDERKGMENFYSLKQ